MPQVVPWQLWPRKTDEQSVVRASQSSWCCSEVQTGAPSQDAIARHAPVKQPSLTSGTWFSGHAGARVVQVIEPRHIPAGSVPVMQVLRLSSHQPKPFMTASASVAHAQVTTQPPLLVSHAEPGLHCASAVPFAFGMHDDRLTSQWKPLPQSLSAAQKPPSVQTLLAQKQPAAHCASALHWKPGGLPPPVPPPGPPVAPFPSPPEPLLPKYSEQPAIRVTSATPTEESSLVMGGRPLACGR